MRNEKRQNKEGKLKLEGEIGKKRNGGKRGGNCEGKMGREKWRGKNRGKIGVGE